MFIFKDLMPLHMARYGYNKPFRAAKVRTFPENT